MAWYIGVWWLIFRSGGGGGRDCLCWNLEGLKIHNDHPGDREGRDLMGGAAKSGGWVGQLGQIGGNACEICSGGNT